MANLSVPVTRCDVLDRARSVIGQGKYKLGSGGRVPKQATPFQDGQCDCSGFVAWCLGVDRYQPKKVGGGDWLETTAVYRDAQNDGGLFTQVMVPRSGDVIVYGDKGGRQGHIGIVSQVIEGKVTKVIHCARSNRPAAIMETAPLVFFRNAAIVARFKHLVP